MAAGLVLGVLPVAAVAQSSPGVGRQDRSVQPRPTPQKPARASIAEGYSDSRLHLKFQEGTAVRLRGGRFTSERDDVSGVNETLRRHPGTRIERLFDRPEATLEREKRDTEARSRRQQADFNLYYRLRLAPRTDARALIDELNGHGIVEIAYAEPLPAAPPATPDLVPEQGYRQAAPDGVDADALTGVAGGRGENVRIIDIEYSWNVDHEDLSKARAAGAMVANGTPSDPFNSTDHGTAVLGELVADDNGFGVTGIASGAQVGMTNASNTEDGYDLADAINVASAALAPGDVIILEQQIAGPNGCDNGVSGCVPVEWVQAFYDAIVAATSSGRIVLQAAGNGGEDLDDTSVYGSPFPAGRPDSGSIIVGAGNYPGCTAPAHGRRGSSTFGSRVDFHAYGECVTTTGYGGRHSGAGMDEWYTGGFNGTSSATPIVTGAAAIASSIAQAQGDVDGLTSTEVRALLAAGATPQDTTSAGALTGNIGPMPDLVAALAPYAPTVDAGGPYTTAEGTDVTLQATGGDPQGQAVTYAWDLDGDGQHDDASGATATFTLVGQDGAFPVSVQARDSGGMTAVDTAVVTVENAQPSVTFSTDSPRPEGQAVTLSGLASDPGWLDPLSATVDWGTGAGAQPLAVTTENVPPDATAPMTASHVYGDDGTYTVTVCARDDDTTRCEAGSVTIGNVDPTAAIDGSTATMVNGVRTLIGHAGEPVTLPTRTTDPGSDDLGLQWTWGDGTSSGQASLLGAVPDLPNSPSVDPRDVSASESHAFGDACTYTTTFSATDDDGGTASDTIAVVIAGNADRLRGAGYWQTNFKGAGSREFSHAQLLCYLGITRTMSGLFDEVRALSTVAQANKVLEASKPTATPEDQLDRQLLTAWLNFANGGADLDELVDTDADGVPDRAFASVMSNAESVRLDPSATNDQLIEQKDLLDRVNTSHDA